MVFSSLPFIFVFLIFFIIIYSLMPAFLKNFCLLLGSFLFYWYGVEENPEYMLLLAGSILINYLLGLGIGYFEKIKHFLLILGILLNVGTLFFFKYASFFMEIIARIHTGAPQDVFRLLLPLGISFYTFQNISYLADIYKGRVRCEKNLIRFGVYAAMFPKLTSGPIVPYRDMRWALRKRKQSLALFEQGLRYFTIGLGFKVLIANRIGGLWRDVAGIGFESISTPLAWMALYAYSFQIYFDFHGYSLMAMGLANMLGFHLPQNFDYPYLSVTMTEFWRKWHMTLGAWFKEYIYIPLGGNRKGAFKTVRNLLIVWIFTGIWHGAGLNFLLWGLFLFAVIVIEKNVTAGWFQRLPALGHLYMAFLIPLSWLLFAFQDMGQLWIYVKRLFPFAGLDTAVIFTQDYIKYGKLYGISFLAAILFSTRIPEKLYRKYRGGLVITLLLLAVFWFSVYCLCKGMNDPFFYSLF